MPNRETAHNILFFMTPSSPPYCCCCCCCRLSACCPLRHVTKWCLWAYRPSVACFQSNSQNNSTEAWVASPTIVLKTMTKASAVHTQPQANAPMMQPWLAGNRNTNDINSTPTCSVLSYYQQRTIVCQQEPPQTRHFPTASSCQTIFQHWALAKSQQVHGPDPQSQADAQTKNIGTKPNTKLSKPSRWRWLKPSQWRRCGTSLK